MAINAMPLVVSFCRSRVPGGVEKNSIRLEFVVAMKKFSVWSLSSPFWTFDSLKDVESKLRSFLSEAIQEVNGLGVLTTPISAIAPKYLFFGLDRSAEGILKKEFENSNFFLTSGEGGV